MLTLIELHDLIEKDIAEIQAMLVNRQPINTTRINELQSHMSIVKDEIIKTQRRLIKELESQLDGAHNTILNRF